MAYINEVEKVFLQEVDGIKLKTHSKEQPDTLAFSIKTPKDQEVEFELRKLLIRLKDFFEKTKSKIHFTHDRSSAVKHAHVEMDKIFSEKKFRLERAHLIATKNELLRVASELQPTVPVRGWNLKKSITRAALDAIISKLSSSEVNERIETFSAVVSNLRPFMLQTPSPGHSRRTRGRFQIQREALVNFLTKWTKQLLIWLSAYPAHANARENIVKDAKETKNDFITRTAQEITSSSVPTQTTTDLHIKLANGSDIEGSSSIELVHESDAQVDFMPSDEEHEPALSPLHNSMLSTPGSGVQWNVATPIVSPGDVAAQPNPKGTPRLAPRQLAYPENLDTQSTTRPRSPTRR